MTGLMLWSAVTIFASMTAVWIASLAVRDASIVDVFWGLGFVCVAGVGLALGDGVAGRKIFIFILIALWGVRLATYIGIRNHGAGEDPRYVKMRQSAGRSFWWSSLFRVFWLQGAIMWIVSLPLMAVAAGTSPSFPSIYDVVGAALWAVGLFFEAVGDWQLRRFKSDGENKGKVMDRGLWRYTRHPNYFGDAAMWWGIGLIAVGVPWGWATLVGPILMTFFLMKVSGVVLLEKSLKNTKPQYAEYVRRTSAFLPRPPKPKQS
jgi:steroid 5-alpha reductase family enzyme